MFTVTPAEPYSATSKYSPAGPASSCVMTASIVGLLPVTVQVTCAAGVSETAGDDGPDSCSCGGVATGGGAGEVLVTGTVPPPGGAGGGPARAVPGSVSAAAALVPAGVAPWCVAVFGAPRLAVAPGADGTAAELPGVAAVPEAELAAAAGAEGGLPGSRAAAPTTPALEHPAAAAIRTTRTAPLGTSRAGCT